MNLSTWKFAFGMALVLAVVASPAFARDVDDDDIATVPFAAPEISVGSLASAATLLTGGYLVLRSRLGRKK